MSFLGLVNKSLTVLYGQQESSRFELAGQLGSLPEE